MRRSPDSIVLQTATKYPQNMLDSPKLVDFSAHLNSQFEVSDGDGVAFEFLETAALKDPFSKDPVDPKTCGRFSLLFQGPENVELPQGMYALRHEMLGDLSLFLVPIGQSDGRYQLEAIFNGID